MTTHILESSDCGRKLTANILICAFHEEKPDDFERMSDCGSCEKEKRQKVNKTEDIVVPSVVTREMSNAVLRADDAILRHLILLILHVTYEVKQSPINLTHIHIMQASAA